MGNIRQALLGLRRSDPKLVHLLLLFLAIKIALVIAVLLGNHLLPFNWPIYRRQLVLDLQALPDWCRAFNTWDTQFYLLLSQLGYGVHPPSNAFFPLFPYFIWMFTPLFFGKPLIAAYVIANVFSVLVPVYMYKLCCLFWTRQQAFNSAVILLAFPTAFYLSLAYTEALYLSICLMAFYYLLKQDVVKSSVMCFLLPLTRAQALLFLAPIAVLFLGAVWRAKGAAGGNKMGPVRTYLPPALAVLAGMGAYFALCQLTMGDFRGGLAAQQLFGANNSLGNVMHPVQWFQSNFVDIKLTLHGWTTSMIDRGAFLLCLPLLIGVYRTQSKALFMYAAVTMLVPALAGSFVAYTRYLLVVFPIFIYIGTRVKRPELVAVPLFALQMLFCLLHTSGYWVA